MAPNIDTLKKDIHRTVLFHLCTYPIENKKSIVPEYIIPQILTTSLLHKKYNGIVFPSTKDYSDLDNYHKFSTHHLNIGIYVPFDRHHDINEELLDTFTIFIWDRKNMHDFSINDVLNKAKYIIDTNTNDDNEYTIPIPLMKIHLEYLSESTISSVNYYDTAMGKIELELYMKMLNYLDKFK